MEYFMRHGNMYAIVIVLITLSLVSLGHAQIVWKKTIDFTDNALQFHVDANGNSILSGANDTRKYDANGNGSSTFLLKMPILA